MIPGFIWVVPCTIGRWKDGDTAEVTIDRGWRDSREREAIRLYGLWCAEMSEPAGPAAKAYAETILPPGTICILHSRTLQSLGRTLGDLRLTDGSDFATLMIAAGHGTLTRTA